MQQNSFPMADVHKELEKAYEPQKGLCGECSMYRPLKKIGDFMVCELCEKDFENE